MSDAIHSVSDAMYHANGVIQCLSDAIPRLSVAMCRVPATLNNKYTYMFTVFSEYNDIHYLTIVSLWTLITTGLSLILRPDSRLTSQLE